MTCGHDDSTINIVMGIIIIIIIIVTQSLNYNEFYLWTVLQMSAANYVTDVNTLNSTST